MLGNGQLQLSLPSLVLSSFFLFELGLICWQQDIQWLEKTFSPLIGWRWIKRLKRHETDWDEWDGTHQWSSDLNPRQKETGWNSLGPDWSGLLRKINKTKWAKSQLEKKLQLDPIRIWMEVEKLDAKRLNYVLSYPGGTGGGKRRESQLSWDRLKGKRDGIGLSCWINRPHHKPLDFSPHKSFRRWLGEFLQG